MEGVVNGALRRCDSRPPSFPARQSARQPAQDRRAAHRRARRAQHAPPGVLRVAGRLRQSQPADAGPSARCMQRLNDAMSAFYAATVELGVADKVTTFTASDFGRTLSSNADGSDHGWGSHHFVMGGAVQWRALLRHRAACLDPDRRPGGAGAPAAEHFGGRVRRDAGALVRLLGRRAARHPAQRRQLPEHQPRVRLNGDIPDLLAKGDAPAEVAPLSQFRSCWSCRILGPSRRGQSCVQFSSRFLLAFAGASLASEQPPTLAIGSAMPAFSLPGIDGKTYTDKSPSRTRTSS